MCLFARGGNQVHRKRIYNPATLANTVKALNEHQAHLLRGRASHAFNYAEWQKNRIKDWKPHALQPIKES